MFLILSVGPRAKCRTRKSTEKSSVIFKIRLEATANQKHELRVAVSPIVSAVFLGFLYWIRELTPTPGSKIEATASAAISWVLLTAMIMCSLPKTYGLLPIQTQQLAATIKSKSNTGRLGNLIAFEEYDCFLCKIRVSRQKWDMLEKGNNVNLTVINSWFGFIVKDVELAND